MVNEHKIFCPLCHGSCPTRKDEVDCYCGFKMDGPNCVAITDLLYTRLRGGNWKKYNSVPFSLWHAGEIHLYHNPGTFIIEAELYGVRLRASSPQWQLLIGLVEGVRIICSSLKELEKCD